MKLPWKIMETNQKPWETMKLPWKPWKPTKNHEKPWNYLETTLKSHGNQQVLIFRDRQTDKHFDIIYIYHHYQQQQYYYLHQYHLLKSQYICRLKSFNLYFVYTPIVHISYMIYHISLSGNKSWIFNRKNKTWIFLSIYLSIFF